MPSHKTPHSLFRETATTVAGALLIFQLFLLAVTVYYVMLPMAKRSADDLSALLVLSAQTWVELPPETRDDFGLELLRKHQFMLYEDLPALPERRGFLPYLSLLDSALSARTGERIAIKVTELDTTWFWAEIHAGGKLIRIGFPKQRLDMNPPMMLLLALAAMVALSLLAALVLARRISGPLSRLSRAAQRIGAGEIPESLPENGIAELSGLAQTFNRMAFQVRELLANRTTLLAGISHDLRTPLTRMRLATEMLPDTTDPKLVAQLRHDIENMNRLIGEFLALSREIQKPAAEAINLNDLLHTLVQEAVAAGGEIVWHPASEIQLSANAMSLRRILSNLIDNALRYGADKPVEIEVARDDEQTVIRVLDSGDGIPAQEQEKVFRPFYRMESSRSKSTGGVGLGLAIVRQLAEANGWKVGLQARAGGGTEARLTIPHPT